MQNEISIQNNQTQQHKSPTQQPQHMLSPQITSSSHLKLSPSLAPQLQTSPIQLSKNTTNFRMLSPQASKEKVEDIFHKMELNTKNFPSKANVCKGESSERLPSFSPKHTNSPIVNYYAGINNTISPSSNYYFSPNNEYGQQSNTMNIRGQYQNFNFSPSAIFNRNTARHLSSGSCGIEGSGNVNNNNNLSKVISPNGTQIIESKTLQEKIEGNFTHAKGSLHNYTKKSIINKGVNGDGDSDDDSDDNQELYMLSFNSEDANEIENMNQGEGVGLDKKQQHLHAIVNSNNNNTNNNPIDNNNNKEDDDDDDEDDDKIEFKLSISDTDVDIGLNNNYNNINFKPKEDNNNNNGGVPSSNFNEVSTQQQQQSILNSSSQTNTNKLIMTSTPTPNASIKQLPQQQQHQFPIHNPHPMEPTINYYSNYVTNYYYNLPNSHQSFIQLPHLNYATPNNPQHLHDNYLAYKQQPQQQQPPQFMNPKPSYQPPQKTNSTKPRTINANDLITTTTANNKKIKRIDPQTYLDESYEYLAHNIFPLAKDQAGCRFLQKKIDDEPEIATSYFYPAILPYILPLVRDPFGNYLIQKLCITLNPDQIIHLLSIISHNILDIGSNSHGTRVIQNFINYLSTPELINYFIQIIKPYIIPLLKELNGTHIIQKFNTDYPSYAHIIHAIVIDNCESLAMHRHGCCVLQKYLDTKDEELKSRLIHSLIDKCLILIVDQFGNYVIQSVLLLKDISSANQIAEKLKDNATYFSKHKYSSNVVEKCFDYCDDNARKKLIDCLSNKETVTDLILDEHGNYVIQKVLACADLKTQTEMLKYITPVINQLKTLNFGERIINRLVLTYPQLSSAVGNFEIKRGGGGSNRGKYNNSNSNNKRKANNNNKNKYK